MKRQAKQLKLYADWYALQLQWEQNILAVYLQANPAQIVEGKLWYPNARTTLLGIGSVSGLPIADRMPTRLAAICAVLSPRVTWSENTKGVAAMLRARYQGQSLMPTKGVAGLASNRNKAWDIANGGDIAQVTGPKVSSFYANLCGDLQRVTIDVWAARVAGVADSDMSHLDGNRYAHLERAYQVVAKDIGFAPAELQAICWIVVRGKGE